VYRPPERSGEMYAGRICALRKTNARSKNRHRQTDRQTDRCFTLTANVIITQRPRQTCKQDFFSRPRLLRSVKRCSQRQLQTVHPDEQSNVVRSLNQYSITTKIGYNAIFSMHIHTGRYINWHNILVNE